MYKVKLSNGSKTYKYNIWPTDKTSDKKYVAVPIINGEPGNKIYFGSKAYEFILKIKNYIKIINYGNL